MPKKPFVLTEKNYFSPDRPHISNSQISDYIKSPEYYFKKHIERSLQRKVTDPMKRGSAVDDILTQDGKNYMCKIERTVGRPKRSCTKKADPDKWHAETPMIDEQNTVYDEETRAIALQDLQYGDEHILSKTYWDQVEQIAEHVKSQPYWKDGLDTAMMQELLVGKINGMDTCGLADRIDSLGDQKFRLIDLKVVNPIKIDNARKWYFNAMEMGYIRQSALYQMLFAVSQGIPPENVECYHVAAAFVEDGYCISKVFKIPQHLLDQAFIQAVYAIQGIKDKNFDAPNLGWVDAQVLGENM